jgi:hypothetical protein
MPHILKICITVCFLTRKVRGKVGSVDDEERFRVGDNLILTKSSFAVKNVLDNSSQSGDSKLILS